MESSRLKSIKYLPLYGMFRTIVKVGVFLTDELLSPSQAGELAECHNDTIRRAIEAGFLPAQRVGRNWIIKRKDVEKWIEEGKPNRRRRQNLEEGETPTEPNDNTTDTNQ